MKYNFDEVIDREKNRSAKYDEREKKFGTRDVIPMWIADMDFRTAQPIIDAAKKKAEEGIWGYTSRPASYYEAVCGWQKRRNGWDVDPKMISFAVGVVPAMSSMVNVFTKPEDKVLIQTPVYSEFYDVTESWGRQVVESPLKEKDGVWSIDWEDFEKKAGEAKMFFLCNPHNPLGIVWSREDLTRMCEICIRHQVLIVSDEIHSDLIFHGKKHIPTATLSEEIAAYVITCTSGTKTFNLAGIQAAAIVFPNQELKGVYDRFWVNLDIHRNNAFSSVIMETAFNEGEEWLEQLLEYISGNFDFIREYCRNAGSVTLYQSLRQAALPGKFAVESHFFACEESRGNFFRGLHIEDSAVIFFREHVYGKPVMKICRRRYHRLGVENLRGLHRQIVGASKMS